MQDKLAQKKRIIEKIAKDRKLVRKEKYKRIMGEIKELKTKEKRILYKEFCRNKESYASLADVRDTSVMSISIMSMIITVFISFIELIVEIRKDEIDFTLNDVASLMYPTIGSLLIFAVVVILVITAINVYISQKTNRCQYIIDIFEDVI